MLELLNTPLWMQFIGDRGVRTLSDARQYIIDGALKSYDQYGFGPYRVIEKASGLSIGMCGLFRRDTLDAPDVGFSFLPGYIGKGYGFESASAVMRYASSVLGLPRVLGITAASNHNSIRLLEKLGLCFEKKISFRADCEESLLFGTPGVTAGL